MKTDWQDQNRKFRGVTKRKSIVVCTPMITGAKNCFGAEHFSLSFLIIQAQEKQAQYLKTINGRTVFLKESILLEYIECDKTKYQAQKLGIIS